jgi:hypothetical protein
VVAMVANPALVAAVAAMAAMAASPEALATKEVDSNRVVGKTKADLFPLFAH